MMKNVLALLMLAVLSNCQSGSDLLPNPEQQIDIDDLSKHIRILASDEFEGRAPSSTGEEKTIRYLAQQFRALGVEPGNGNSYFQAVSLIALTASGDLEIALEKNGTRQSLKFPEDMVVWTKQIKEQVSVYQSELVFVGYGIVAPEFSWNDYKDTDVHGKTVVILVNDPGYATEEDSIFNGRSMTYYGRWTYKYEEAARQGAAGALIIHETGPAGYPWEVVSGGWGGKQFDLITEDENAGRCQIEGWITVSSAGSLFELAGLNMKEALEAAKFRDFEPQGLKVQISTSITNQIEKSESQNVIAKITGAERPDEYIIYSAHWDHLGKNPDLEGDQIYNGARDNASGTAALLELAQAFKAGRPPDRTILFLAVTAEEQGLLGSAFYAGNPIYPVEQTVANLNMDALDIWGKMKDVIVIGYGNSQLDEYLATAAKSQGRKLRPDPESEKGYYFRSDHLSFAKQGIPALYTKGGLDHLHNGEQWTMEQKADHTANRYHKPGDEFDDTWDLSGTVDDIRLLFSVGSELANNQDWPNWNEGVAFKATRDSQRK